MDLSLKLFEEGNADALKFVMFTDMGNKDMNGIRSLARQLDAMMASDVQQYEQSIKTSLLWAHIGVTSITLIGLFAFYLYLRQNKLVARLHRREQALQSEERSRLSSWCVSAQLR